MFYYGVVDISEVNGLAVDWVNKLIYWTDAQRQTIEVCDYHNTGRIVLINTGLSEPRAIVAEPVDGYIRQTIQTIVLYL